jgi:hypothetical protein
MPTWKVFGLALEFRLFLVLAGLLLMPSGVLALDDSAARSLLHYTNWRASAFSRQAGGTVCWLAGEDGSLRLELRRGPAGFASPLVEGQDGFPPDLGPLLDQSGEGWTLVLGPDDTGTLNAWGREWRRPPSGLVQLVRLVTAVMVHHPGPIPDPGFVRAYPRKNDVGRIPVPKVVRVGQTPAVPSNTRRYQLGNLGSPASEPSSDEDFRGRMTARGLGGGGDLEVVVLDWGEGPGRGAGGVRIRSTRRPGTLELEALRSQEVPVPAPEFFLPLWPMVRFF